MESRSNNNGHVLLFVGTLLVLSSAAPTLISQNLLTHVRDLQCGDQADGFHVDPSSDCQRFYFCVNRQAAWVGECLEGARYDVNSATCRDAAEVYCTEVGAQWREVSTADDFVRAGSVNVLGDELDATENETKDKRQIKFGEVQKRQIKFTKFHSDLHNLATDIHAFLAEDPEPEQTMEKRQIKFKSPDKKQIKFEDKRQIKFQQKRQAKFGALYSDLYTLLGDAQALMEDSQASENNVEKRQIKFDTKRQIKFGNKRQIKFNDKRQIKFN